MVRNVLLAPAALVGLLAPFVCADVEFVAPKAGDQWEAGGVEVKWRESGVAPALTDLTSYDLFLCAGSNDEYVDVLHITAGGPGSFPTGNKYPASIGSGLGASTPQNAYFFRMTSTAAKGGTVTNFSPRFSLSGMEGTFPPNIVAALKDVSGTDGPGRIDKTSDGGPAAPGGNEFEVEYTMQTGPTRYAPMQPIPPTKITKKKATPLHPTSAFTIATTFLARPTVQTTITQSQTFSISSRENTAAPAPMPTDDMAKFLARWKD
ncbi:uncharacterized protein EI97DRAFT_269151 [Westerdykella ornata]|uniref:Uncharacterized protein n=1 Tax=Westerdykella ornata TaxID=318751 RepID=A0A6A6J4U7_WESOR|nr:uncharacterized protein EI97DRAFT_269151 [Westerdykella ornata]KAF2271465.1 hypothetical protein EI97DRAFT_269151 [Westerdykella ornata]